MEEKRFLELGRRCARSGRACYSRFLEPSSVDLARRCGVREGAEVDFFGGYPEAERVVAAFFPEGEEPQYPVECLDVTWNPRFAQVGHRDLLGAVMGLNIDREVTGDIVLAGEGKAYLFVLPEMAEYVIANLESAGRASVKVSRHEGDVECPEPEGERVRITLASLRLDAFVASGYNLSRAEAQKRINAGLVKLNHVPNLHTDAPVKEGDLLSVRGFGRMKVEQLTGETRRGRLAAQIFRYGGK